MTGVILMMAVALAATVAMAAVFTALYETYTEDMIVARALQMMAADEEVTGEQAFQFMLAMAAR